MHSRDERFEQETHSLFQHGVCSYRLTTNRPKRVIRVNLARDRWPVRFHLSACFLETRSPVHQPLARGTFNSGNHALSIRNLAMIPAESKLIAITVKMFLGNLVKDSVVTALQETEETFRRVDVNDYPIWVAASVFMD